MDEVGHRDKEGDGSGRWALCCDVTSWKLLCVVMLHPTEMAEQHGLLPAAEKTTRGRTAGTSVSEWGKKKYSAATLYTKQHFLILNINKPPHPH